MFINYAFIQMKNIDNMKAMVIIYTNSNRTVIDHIKGKSAASPKNKPGANSGNVVFFENQYLSEAQTNWAINSPGVTMDLKIWQKYNME